MDKKIIDNFSTLLFDLDGTLADSMALHNQAWLETLQEFGCPMTAEILQEYAGISNPKTVTIFNQRFGWKLDPQLIAQKKEQRFREIQHRLKPIESVWQIAKEYFQKKPMAIVSGGGSSNGF